MILKDYVLRIGEDKISKLEEDGLLFEGLLEKYEEIVEELNDEEHFNSFKLLGFEINKGALISFVVFILSLALTFYEIIG